MTDQEKKELGVWIVELIEKMGTPMVKSKLGFSDNEINNAKGSHPCSDESLKRIYENVRRLYTRESADIKSKKQTAIRNYLYYYYSSKYKVSVAKISFHLNVTEDDWLDGALEYLDINNDYTTKWTFDLKRIWPGEGSAKNSRAAFYMAKCVTPPMDEQINFFTININSKKLDDRKILFLTYSVLETGDKKPSSGVGLLIEEKEPRTKLEKIKDSEIDPWIVNTLRNKKHTLDGWISNVYIDESIIKGNPETNIKPEDKQFHSINAVSGFYKGYYLRSDIPSTEKGINDLGGIVCTVIQIKDNGEAFVYYKLAGSKKVDKYRGYVFCPNEDKQILKISLKLDRTHLLYMFLKQIDSERLSYKGTLAGLKKKEDPFSTAIFVKKIQGEDLENIKITKIEDLERLLNSKLVGRIHKSIFDLSNHKSHPEKKNEVDEIIQVFSDKSQFLHAYYDCMEIIEKCLPKKYEAKKK